LDDDNVYRINHTGDNNNMKLSREEKIDAVGTLIFFLLALIAWFVI
jgi:hypothetical protein